MITASHPLTAAMVETIKAAHSTIIDDSQPIESRRFALLVFEALDDASARYDNDFKPEQIRADVEAFAEQLPELPTVLTTAA